MKEISHTKFLTLREERPGVLERNVLTEGEKVAGELRKLLNEELHGL
jgi:hypothetical protein